MAVVGFWGGRVSFLLGCGPKREHEVGGRDPGEVSGGREVNMIKIRYPHI